MILVIIMINYCSFFIFIVSITITVKVVIIMLLFFNVFINAHHGNAEKIRPKS